MSSEAALPAAPADAWRERARLLKRVRTFFDDRDVMEVETPILSRSGNSDPGITQFCTTDSLWLRTSTEYPMKRMLCAGSGDIFELGRVFRAGEAGAWHNPEFTMLEWYRVAWDYDRLMGEVAELLNHCGEAFGRRWPVRRVSYRDWLREAVDLDPLTASKEEIADTARAGGVKTHGMEDLDRDGWLDLLISHRVQPALPRDQITLVSLYPASQAALARLHDDDPRLAERFEVYLGAVELANGYQELTDPVEQRGRFEAENRRRERAGLETVPLDEHLLEAMAVGLPRCAGVALGLDRLLMALMHASHMDDVLAFPAERA